MKTEPVRHHDPVKTPLAAQHVAQQPFVIGAEGAAQPVVRRHDRPHPGSHCPLKGHEVELAQRSLIDLSRDRHPLKLGVVADEVLDATGHPLLLHTTHIGDGHLSGQERVLTHALEVAPPDRGPMQIDRRREQHMRRLRPRLTPKRASDLTNELPVK